MFVVKKSHHNPLIVPTKENLWESVATFNACPIKVPKTVSKKNPFFAIYRAMGTPRAGRIAERPRASFDRRHC